MEIERFEECAVCGETLTGNQIKYCSLNCKRKRSHKRKEQRKKEERKARVFVCKGCGIEFHGRKRKFCTDECRDQVGDYVCKECGEEFHGRKRKFCCYECARKNGTRKRYQRKKQEMKEVGVCAQCKKEPRHNGKGFCEGCLRKANDAQKQRNKERSEQGLCITCGVNKLSDKVGVNKKTKQRSQCQSCYEEFKQKEHERKQHKHKMGLCNRCGKHPYMEGNNHCVICGLKGSARRYLGSSKEYPVLVDLFRRQGQRCPYTGDVLKLGVNCELDHKIPISRGGEKLGIGNLEFIRADINQMKRALTKEEFLDLIKVVLEHTSA